MDLHSRIRKHLGGEKFKLFVPQCVVAELRAIGAPVELALDFALAHCEQVATAHGARPNDAVKGLVGRTNPRRFFVATQEDDLRSFLRSLPGVPLLHLQRTVLLLETPSSASRKVKYPPLFSAAGRPVDADAFEYVSFNERREVQASSVRPVVFFFNLAIIY